MKVIATSLFFIDRYHCCQIKAKLLLNNLKFIRVIKIIIHIKLNVIIIRRHFVHLAATTLINLIWFYFPIFVRLPIHFYF